MGRQIHIASILNDEKQFLSFIKNTAEIAIFECQAETREKLWVKDFSENLEGHYKYSIWNKSFPWKPEYGQVIKSKDPNQNGLFYVSNSHDAPIIEFSRTNMVNRNYGRIYWAKFFSAPDPLDYDVDAFSKWFDKIVRWVKKKCKRDSSDPYSPYFFENAWKIHIGAQQKH